MVGRANSSARGRRLMLGVIVALVLLVVIGRIQRGDLDPRQSPPTGTPVRPSNRCIEEPIRIPATQPGEQICCCLTW